MKPSRTPQPQKATAHEPDPGSYILEIASYTRCSRPLCSSQTTTPHHTPHTHMCVIGAAGKPETNVPHPQPPTKKSQPAWSCCFRTQQCAKHYPPPPAAAAFLEPNPEGSVRTHNTTGNTGHLFADIPPLSTRHETFVRATGILLTTPPPGIHPAGWL